MKPALFLIPIILLLVLTIPASAQQTTGITSERLTGLLLLTESHQVIPAQKIEGAIFISWDSESPITITNIDVGVFETWFTFSQTPFTVQVKPIEADSIQSPITIIKSQSEIRYLLTTPRQFCDQQIGITQDCVDKVLYRIPLELTLEFQGIDYTNDIEILVDFREIPVDLVTIQYLIIGIIVITIILGAGNVFRKSQSKKKKTSSYVKRRTGLRK